MSELKKVYDETLNALRVTGLSRVVTESHADVSVVNSTTETAIIDFTLPAAAVAVGDLVRVRAYGDALNNSGGNVNATFKFKFGTTTVLTTAAFAFTSNAARRKWDLEVDVAFPTTATERVGASFGVAGATTDNWTLASAFSAFGRGYGTASENTATSKAVQVTVTLDTAHANADFVTHFAFMELVKK